ncbi:Tumor protein p63-regulated gene 1 protein [Bienertia sinuspersici]
MGETNNRILPDYGVPRAFAMNRGIAPPLTQANDFELKPALIELKVCQNDKDWGGGERATTSKKGGMYEVEGIHLLSSKVDALVTQLKQGTRPSTTSLESMLQTFMENQAKETNELKENLKQMQIHNKMLEQQIAQMATKGSYSSSSTIPSQPTLPRDQANAITTRSGKTLGEVRPPSDNTTKTNDENVGKDEGNDNVESNNLDGESSEPTPITMSKDSEVTKDGPPPYNQKLPYLARFEIAKLDDQFAKFLEVLKKLCVNIPFTEALKKMPTYAKFLKDIKTKRRELASVERINLTESCSAIIKNKLPTKLKDPGSISIPCAIGDFMIDKALCVLGDMVSLMPQSICQRLNLGELKPTRISLQLADRSVKLPLGVLEDVPLRIGKLYVPADCVGYVKGPRCAYNS